MESFKKDISVFTSGEWRDAQWQKKAATQYKTYARMLQKPNKNKILKQLPHLHEEAFSVIDCLNCTSFHSPDEKTEISFLSSSISTNVINPSPGD